MQAVTRALRALARGIMRLWRYWMADIGKRKSFVGKLASIGIGLFAICCLCSVGLGVTRSAGQAVGLVPPNTPTAQPEPTAILAQALPTEAPAPTKQPAPTQAIAVIPSATALPSATPVPTEPPTATPAPTVAPTRASLPTARPKPTVAPAPVAKTDPKGKPPQGGECPAAYPVKGNQSGIYHTPASRYYTRTKPEWCFATAADAEAAGFRAPKQ